MIFPLTASFASASFQEHHHHPARVSSSHAMKIIRSVVPVPDAGVDELDFDGRIAALLSDDADTSDSDSASSSSTECDNPILLTPHPTSQSQPRHHPSSILIDDRRRTARRALALAPATADSEATAPKRVQFDPVQKHRPATKYRRPAEYARRSLLYAPGRFCAPRGREWMDTSFRYRDWEEYGADGLGAGEVTAKAASVARRAKAKGRAGAAPPVQHSRRRRRSSDLTGGGFVLVRKERRADGKAGGEVVKTRRRV